MKKISNIFIALAIILSDVMCAVIAYNYCAMQWGVKYAGYSTPASVAFLYLIPYGIGIAVCVGMTMVLKKRKITYYIATYC